MDRLTLTPDFVDLHASLEMLCKRAGAALVKHYEGWKWIVMPDGDGHVIDIFSNRISLSFGYRLKVSEIQNDPTDRWAVQAGGDLLRRFGFRPEPFRRQKVLLQLAPKDLKGECIPDMSDGSNSNLKRQLEISRTIATGSFQVATDATGKPIIKIKR